MFLWQQLVWVVLLSAATAQAQPTRQRHPMLDIDAIMHGVAAAKQEVVAALANPDAAFEAYLKKFALSAARMGHHPVVGGTGDSKSKAERQQIFLDNLARANAFNSDSKNAFVAWGITHFAHLTQQEFAARYLGQNFTAAQQQPAGMQGSTDLDDVLDQGVDLGLMQGDSERLLWLSEQSTASRRLLGRTQMLAGGEAAALRATPPTWQALQQCTGMRSNPYSHIVPPAAGVDW